MNISTFESISSLIDTHGEPIDCEIADCEDCKQILFARKFYSGGEGNKKKHDNRSQKYVYTAIDEHGKERKFKNYSAIRKFLKCHSDKLNAAFNKDISVNGYFVYKERVEE